MGLDQYAYARKDDEPESANQGIAYQEIAYWRKHNRLHGWMDNLWREKMVQEQNMSEGDKFLKGLNESLEQPVEFNNVEMELTAEDIDNLEAALNEKSLPETSGFFFGPDSDEYYDKEDRMFIENAREYISKGYKVYYNSWW